MFVAKLTKFFEDKLTELLGEPENGWTLDEIRKRRAEAPPTMGVFPDRNARRRYASPKELMEARESISRDVE